MEVWCYFLKSVIILTTLLFLTFAANAKAPCWFWNPVDKDKIGFVGAASPFSIKKDGSKLASRQRALVNFADYYKVELGQITDDALLQDAISVDQYQLRFSSPFISELGMFSYALVVDKHDQAASNQASQWLNSECQSVQCEFKACKPQWLCDSDNSHIFGVSQMTSTPSMQLAKMKANAQTLAAYLQQSDVEDQVKKIESTGTYQNWRLQQRSSNVDAVSNASALINSKVCTADNFIFGLFDSPSQLSNDKHKGFDEWLRVPALGQKAGVVGSFSGITADGLFSTSVKYAIKDGLVQLAKIKHVNIDHEYQLTFNKGWYTLSKSTESTSATVSGTLMDLKVVEEDRRLVIYAWLIEN